MLNKEDEEYRKRKERAKQLRSIVNVNNETDTDYTAKKERAKELRNFAGMTTYNDKLADEERIKQKMDELWEENSQVSTQDISSLDDAQNKTAIQKNIIQNNIEKLPNINQGVKVQSQSTDKIPNYRNYNTTLPSVKNIPIIKSDMSNMTKATPMTISAIGEANQRNEEIKKGGYHSINATITSILKNIEGGVKSPAAGLVDAVTTLTALGVRGFETWAKIFNNERSENKLNDIYNNLVDSGGKIKEKGEYESNVTARINNTAIRTAGQVTNTITEMLTNQAIGMALGVDGTLMQGITVGGRSAQEVLDENEGHIGKATVTGVAKGYVSYLTEKMFDANILTRGKGGSVSDKVDELIYNTIKGKVGKEIANKTVGVIGENLEELVEDNVDNLIDKIINDKDFPEWKEWLNSTSETVKITSLSTIIMDLLGIGGGRFEDKESDIINRKMERKIQKIIDDGGLAIKYNDTINQEDIGQFYTTTFNQDGTLKDIEITSGKQIVNVNSKLNIKPVIIKKANTNIYNVIDGNTGLLLDNSPYTSTLSAEQWFDHKIINIDEASIKGINSKVAKSNIALQNKIIEVANEAQQQLNHMPQKLTEQPQNSNIKNETTNYMGNVENNQDIENNKNRNMEDRTYENVSNKNVKPYSEEHPELSQDIKDMAANFMEDLEYSLPGKRYKAGDTWTGQKRSTTKELAEFKDATGVSWDKIRNILNDIYEGKGNYALAKKMEIELDKALTEGYQNIYGQTIMPNENYINKKGKIEGKSYRNDNTSSIDYDIEDSRIFGMKKNSSKSNYNKNVDTLNKQTNNYEDVIRSINNFKKAKRNIDRYDILNIANSLDIKLKPGAKLVNDTEMSKKAGNNIKPSIVNITDIFKNITDKTAKSFRSEAENIALELFRDIEVTIIDTNSITEINKSGIDKTFSGTVTESKIQTADNIKEIIEQGVYAFTSYNPTDKNKVLYHHFFAPVNYKGKNGLVRVVIKEFTKDSTVKDKFYYHQLEYIDNNKIEDINSALPQLNGNKDFELISSTNTISQDNKIVKSKTSVNNKNMQKIETIYRKFSKDFKEKGYVDLNNKTVKDIKEVADIAQIFRNPNYETFRMIYTRDNTIVGQEAISSRIPGQTKVFEDNNRAKGFYKIKNRMNRLNADGYYMVHNHPSGKAVASQIDINTTQLFIKNIPGFKGHVIVNSGTYATIERENGALSKLVANNEMVIENYKPDDIDKLISKEPWANIKINSNKQIATLMHDVKNNPNYSTLILTDSQSYPRILLDIPNNFFNMSSSQIDGYIKNISKQNGATRAFIATTNNDVYKSSNKLTTITDSILYSVKDNEIYETDTFSKHNEGITETKVFNNSNLKTKNTKQNTSNNDIRSLKKNNTEVDNLGRKLTKQQQEFFKDSKVRNDNGNLMVMYHGTEANVGIPKEHWFNTFDIDKAGNHGNMLGNGFYFTSEKTHAEQYAHTKGNIYEVYLNIKKPLDLKNFSTGDLAYSIRNINPYIEADIYKKDGTIDGYKVREYLIKNGYDGIHSGNTYVAFYSNQIKNINNSNPTTSDDIRYLKKSATTLKTEKDNLGRSLSKQQQEYFKNSKVRDENGNLLTVYHGTDTKFTVFNYDYLGKNGTANGKGFYLADDINVAKSYSNGKNLIEAYVDIQKPLSIGKTTITENDYIKFLEAVNDKTNGGLFTDYGDGEKIQKNSKQYNEIINQFKEEYKYGGDDVDLVLSILNSANITLEDGYRLLKNTLGYDGIIVETNYKNNGDTIPYTQYIPLIPEQIKNIDNTTPTDNPDIRYLQKTSKQNIPVDENIQKELHNRIQNAILSKNSRKNTFLGVVSDKVANKVKSLLGIDISGREHIITDYDIRHIIKQHGNPEIEKTKGQIAITSKDIEKIPDIINNYDKIVQGTDNKQGETIRYIKNYPDNKCYVVEVIPMANDTSLYIKTMWKKPVTLTNSNNTPSSTSETRGNLNSSTSTTSISQNPENVNNSKKTADIEAGQRNAERADAYIEQEIKKIEATGEWDDSIPVTKMTDIRKSIEDYLGIGVQKGHFRQRAYGIYNTKTDSIRTKELKDMDSILHEVGHAIDLGNRISVDKESIANELLAAINKYGGYEGNPRSVLLDEGFAEVIREYAIIPEQAKSEYPQSVAVLEGIRANDKSFDKFISDTQQQIYNYIHQSPQNRVMSNLSVGEQTDKVPLTKKTLKEKIVKLVWDKDYALKAAVEDLSNGKKLDPSQNAYILTRLASGVNNKAISIITNGYIDLEGNKTFGGLGKLGDILGIDEQRFNDLRAYLVAKRDLEYKAKTLKTGIRTMDSKAVVDKFKNDTQIQRAAKVVYDTLDGVLQYAVDNGLITRTDADILRQDNAFYVPFQRVIENNGNQVGKRGEVKNIIKRRTGSELDVKDVLENIVVNSVNIIKQVENNNILRALYKEGESAGIINNIFEKIPAPMKKIGTENLAIWEKELKKQGIDIDNIDLEKTIDIFVPDNKTDVGNRITSFIDDDGKRVYLQFSKDATDIFNTVMNLDSQTMSKVLKLNSVLNMPLRYGATMANIGFAIPNMISDTTQAMIYSGAGFIPVVDNALGVLDILTATNKSVSKFMNKVAPEYAKRIDALYTMYEQSGATSSTRMSQYRKSTQEIMRDVYGTKNSEVLGIKDSFKPLKRLLDLMTYIPEISEQSTRFRVFEKNYSNSIAKGNTELDARIKAAIESRDATQDFGRTGNFTREINQLIPFSAARVGSAYTFAEKIKANPKATSMRIAILTAIAMGIQAIGYDDKEIEELNQRKKDDNFVLKFGDKVITIKKPQGILRSIVNLAEYIQDLATGHIEEGKEGERLGEWLRNAIMDNMPADEITGLVPNAVAPLIENAINKDFYYNTEIVKSYDLNLPDEEQYYDYNSQLAILLGKIFNYSPAKIDNLISAYLGGLGTQLTNIIDYVSGKLGINAEKPDMGIEQNSIGKRFVVNVNTNSASIDEIYTRRDELTKKLNGGTITADEEKELDKIKDAIKNLSNINKQIKAIKQDLTMSGKEKAEKIRPLQEQKTDTARQALGKELINSNNTSKIESTKFYPSNSTLKNNGYTLALTEKMKKEYENLAYEKYKQYKKQGLYSDEYLEKLETTCKEYAKKSLMQKYRNKLVKSK